MANRWTAEQSAAIASRNQNLLLSAAAGSGKTAVLVQRIISRLTDSEKPVAADRLLVVTFTNAAAAEMKERIVASLTSLSEQNPQDAFLADQLLLIKKAQITTIDSFCIDLLRKNFVRADLPPDFKIADPTENAVMRAEVLDEVLTELYDDGQYAASFFELLESYANAKANDRGFRELIDSIYLFSESLPNPKEWLLRAADDFGINRPFSETVWCKAILEEVRTAIDHSISDYNVMISLAQEDALTDCVNLFLEERKMLEEIKEIQEYDALKTALDTINFGRRKAISKDLAPKYIDYIDAQRKVIKKRVTQTQQRLLSLSAQKQSEAILKTYPQMRCLAETVIRLRERFLAQKEAQNLLDFSDCEHRCLALLSEKDGTPSETAQQVQKMYDEIYIDEYQDTSRLQEAIFTQIKQEDNLFMVGDIKQSIYRFRNTDPSLFKAKRDSFQTDEDAKNRKIVLSKNFRSRANVLDSVNYIFERIMSEETGEIDYDETEKLYPGLDYPDTAPNPIDAETQLCLIDLSDCDETEGNDGEELEKLELEAIVAANRICELMESGYEVFAGGEYRKIRYSDICIIARNVKDSAPVLSSVLSDQGIPCYAENTGGFLGSSEVTALISLLSVIDNPYQDLPLLAVLRSVLFRFTADDLGKIRAIDKSVSFYDALFLCSETDTNVGARCREALALLNDFMDKSRYLSVSELVMEIYNTTGFYDAQQTRPNGVIRRANLRLLYNRAKEYEKMGRKGLYSFIRFISDYEKAGGDFDAAKTVGQEQDAVRIMSIHKSKGLEFPVVILFGIERKFNMMDLRKNVLYHASMGFGPKFCDTTLRITYPFAPRVACESKLCKEAKAEEMRILYVAMTRAREKLILIGAVRDLEKKINSCARGGKRRNINASIVADCESYLDWLLTALINHPDCDALRKRCDLKMPVCEDKSRFSLSLMSKTEVEKAALTQQVQEEKKVQEEGTAQFIELMEYIYPNASDIVLPPKITVTELKRRLQEQAEDSVYLYPPQRRIKQQDAPLAATEIGTAYHTVMQRCDLAKELNKPEIVQEEILRIHRLGFLSQEEVAILDCQKIARFFSSEAGQKMLGATRVRREVMFGISCKANELLPEFKSEKEIMLQGVIDCLLETDEGLVVLDYKTDKTVSPQRTAEKYKIQLECYKMAAERIYKKNVTEKILYLFDVDTALNL